MAESFDGEDTPRTDKKRQRHPWKDYLQTPYRRWILTEGIDFTVSPKMMETMIRNKASSKGLMVSCKSSDGFPNGYVEFQFYEKDEPKPIIGHQRQGAITGPATVTDATAELNPDNYVRCVVCDQLTNKVPNLGEYEDGTPVVVEECTERDLTPGPRRLRIFPVHRNTDTIVQYGIKWSAKDGVRA